MALDANQRIAQLEAELAALRGEMQDFTYTVSHDMRASLRHVISYLHLVQEDAGDQLTAEVAGFLQTAGDSARHMGALMDGLLELSRVGTAPLAIAALPWAPLVREALHAQAASQAVRERQIEWQLGEGLRDSEALPAVAADSALLRLALGHVLDNAVKFTAPRALTTIALDLQTTAAGGLTLSVKDNGVGFNSAYVGQLFRPFQRLHTARQFAGIGMGLALTRKIFNRLGGAVAIQGEPELGCWVQLTLPAAG